MPIILDSLGYAYQSAVRPKRVPKLFKLFSLCLVAVLLGAGAYYFVFYLPIGNLLNLNRNRIFSSTELFAVSMSSFQDYSQAVVLAEELKAQGAAGYILKQNNQYYVLLSAYESEEDATKVKNRLNLENQTQAQILPITLSSFVIQLDFSSRQLVALKQAVGFGLEQYRLLYELSIDYDSALLSVQETMTKINEFVETCETVKETYNSAFQSVDDYSVVYVKIYLNNILSVLKSVSSSARLSSQLKYAYFQVLSCYQDLQNNV